MNFATLSDSETDASRWRARSILQPSVGTSKDAEEITRWLRTFSAATPTFAGRPASRPKQSLEETLYDALASYKIQTSLIAMHLPDEWRSKLFKQLDYLLAVDEWDGADIPPLLASYNTFIRLLLNVRPDRRPGLGASHDGHFIATWTRAEDRLTFECLPHDQVKWSLSRTIDGERERAAGITSAGRVAEVIVPYEPQHWFAVDGDSLRPAQ